LGRPATSRHAGWALIGVTAAWVWSLAIWTTCCVGARDSVTALAWVVGLVPPVAAAAYSTVAAVRAAQAGMAAWCVLTAVAASSCVGLVVLMMFAVALRSLV
jgi:hypothetical protein